MTGIAFQGIFLAVCGLGVISRALSPKPPDNWTVYLWIGSAAMQSIGSMFLSSQ